jgi:DnaD/phage-associated family protein
LTYKDIAARASVSAARARSATELWRAEGVLGDEPTHTENCDARTDNIKDEFEERFTSDLYEERSVDTARTIRDGELSELLSECAALLDKPALSTEEIKKITSVYSQLSLSAEYIFTLAAHLAESGKFTATNLAKKAESLSERGVDTLEALCVYIEEEGRENGTDKEFRRLFGIWNRKLSKAEREYFKKWSEEFGYSTEIVGEAYGIMTSNNASGGVSLRYIDTVLTRWYEAGCKTVAQCRAESERQSAEKVDKNTNKSTGKRGEIKPKFVDFDVEDAFKRALERSFPKDKKED